MTAADKKSLRERLESCVVYEQVLPTLTVPQEQRARLRDFAGSLRQGDLGKAGTQAFEDARGVLGADSAIDSAIPQMAESEPITEQVADFADAGFNFVRVSNDFQAMSAYERTAQGGAGAVSRVMRLDDTLLLETERISVRLHDHDSQEAAEAFADRHNLVFQRRYGLSGISQFLVQDDFSTYKCLELLDDGDSDFAEPDYIERIGQRYLPVEPEFSNQWHHAAIDAPNAWDISRGDPVRVGFVDVGFHLGIPDIAVDARHSAWFRSTPGGDDADFIGGIQNMPENSHGTACAAMLASPENGVGGVGVAFNASLRVIASLNTDTVGTQATLARALAFAVDPSIEDSSLSAADGVDVLGCSLGPQSAAKFQLRQTLRNTLDDIASYGRNGLGVPVFWACTNGNHPVKEDEVCSHPEVIAVGRSTVSDQDHGSGYGPELDFLAPGVRVHLPDGSGGYRSFTGTSYACPCATGVAALVLAQDSSLTAHEVRQHLRDGCDKIGNMTYSNGHNKRFGYGRINARNSI